MANTNETWRERVPQGSTLGPHNVPTWIGSVKLIAHNWDSHQSLLQRVFCPSKVIVKRSATSAAYNGSKERGKEWKKELTNPGNWERLGKEEGKISGNIWKEGKRVKGLGSCIPYRFWSFIDILIKTCQHTCRRKDTKTQYITTLFTELSPQWCIHEWKSQPHRNISIVHDTFVSDTWWATERRRNHHIIHITQQQTQCTSNTHSHIPPHTAAMVIEPNPPTSW